MPIVFNGELGGTYYAQFSDGTLVALTAGAGNLAKRFTATDAAIVTAGLAQGDYDVVIVAGTTGSASVNDERVSSQTVFSFDGTNEVTPLDTLISYLPSTGPLMSYSDLSEIASATAIAQVIGDIGALPTVDDIVAGVSVANFASPEEIDDAYTWRLRERNGRAYNTVDVVAVGLPRPLAMDMTELLNGTRLLSVVSVTASGVTFDGDTFLPDRTGQRAHFTATAWSTGNVEIQVVANTVTNETVVGTGRLRVR